MSSDTQTGINTASIPRPHADARGPSNDMLSFLVESVDGFCCLDRHGVIEHANKSWCTALGWSTQEIVHQPIYDFLHKDDRLDTKKRLRALRRDAATAQFRTGFWSKRDACHELQWNVRWEQKNDHFYATLRDLTLESRRARESIAIVEDEKKRIGCELHDGLCQSLAGIAALSAALSRELPADAEAPAKVARDIAGLLATTIDDAQNMARGLGTSDLGKRGLKHALARLGKSTQNLFRVSCVVSVSQDVDRLPRELELHLLRIAQESVRNALKHGHAEHISITLVQMAHCLSLAIEDDGVGLPNQKRNDGIGIDSMMRRARLLGANIEFRPGRNAGTAVVCTLPRRAAAAANPATKLTSETDKRNKNAKYPDR